jgi:molecular chaperone DnaK
VNESREKLPVGELSKVDAAIAEARRAAQTDDPDAIRKATDELQRASHAIAEHLYKAAQGSQGAQAEPHGSQDSNVKEGEVVDAEYAETK